MTARRLAALLAEAGVTVASDGGRLTLSAPAPAGLLPAVRALKSGLAALATRRRWFGCVGSTGRCVVLDPAEPVPAGVTLLTVEGAAKWDRVPSAARLDHPELFSPDPPAATRKAARAPARKPVLL